MNRFSPCSGDEKNAIHFNGTINRILQSKYVINGEFTLDETAIAPIEVYSNENTTFIINFNNPFVFSASSNCKEV